MSDIISETVRPRGPRWLLREATADLHEAVDSAFGAYDLSTRDGYRRFLMAMARVFVPVERALEAAGADRVIADWPVRRRSAALAADLRDLDAHAEPHDSAPDFDSEAALLGAAYVLEGSRLGGAMLSRGLPDGAPARFLSGPKSSWPAFVQLLDERLSGANLDQAVLAARDTFTRFQVSALRGTPTQQAA